MVTRFEALLLEGKESEAIYHMESMILNGLAIPFEILSQFPSGQLQNVPIVYQYYGEQLMNKGYLLKAKPVLVSAMQGLLQHNLKSHFLNSFAHNALLNLRLGFLQEAKDMLIFLNEEYRRKESEMGGMIPLALANGCHLTGDEKDPYAYYQEAISLFEIEGYYDRVLMTAVELLVRLYHRLDRSAKESILAMIGYKILNHPQFAPLLSLIQGIDYCYQQRWLEGKQSLLEWEQEQHNQLYPVNYHLLSLIFSSLSRLGLQEDVQPLMGTLERQMQSCDLDLEIKLYYESMRMVYYTKSQQENLKEQCLTRLHTLYQLSQSPYFPLIHEKIISLYNAPPKNSQQTWRVYGFGKFRIANEMHEIPHMVWKRKKAKELFLYLLLQPNYTAHKDLVIELLFDGDEYDKSHNQLYVTLHQLRSVMKTYLDNSEVVRIENGMIRLEEPLFEYTDFESYLTCIKVGNQLWPTQPELAIELYEQACMQYDELVPELKYIDWLDRVREEFIFHQISIIKKLIHYARQTEKAASLESLYDNWMRIQPYEEEPLEEAIRHYAEVGDAKEAKRLYRKLEVLCLEELGTEPSHESKQLISSLPYAVKDL
jgi:DNA-binding SARP family transcriptional activator